MKSERANEPDSFEVAGYQVVPSKNIVVFEGKALSITPKMLSVLAVLAENQGQTVSKDVLLNSVWGGTITTDMVLSRAISDLRKTFGDSARKQEFISTISKQGYCLNKPVTWKSGKFKKRSTVKKASGVLSVLVFMLTVSLISNLHQDEVITFPSELSSAPRLKNITADKMDQRYARFSRDGKKLAYLEKTDQNTNFRVLVRTLASEQLTVVKEYIERSDLLAVNFAFSKDGSLLALKELNANGCKISIVKLSNLEEKILKVCPESPIASIDWFPNSSELLITNYNKKSESVGLAKLNIDSEKISHFKIEHKEPIGLLFPRISQSGQSILLVSFEPRSELWGVATFAPESEKLEFAFKIEHKINQAVWHEPGKSFFYVVESGEEPGVWFYDLENKSQKHIHTIDRNIRDLDFNLRSNQFAYIQEEYNLDIWKVSVDSQGNVLDQPLGLASSENSNPRLSPNEKFLAFFSTGRGQHELLVYDLESQHVLLRYQKEDMKFVDISWSPDSRYLLLTTSDKDVSKLYQVDSRTGNATQIETQKGYNPFRGRWSASNNNMYWSEQKNGLWRVVERNSNDEQRYFPIDLRQEYLFLSDGSILYKEGGNYLTQNTIFSCRLENKNCNAHLQGNNEEVIVTNRYLSAWDYKNETIFYTLFNPETLRYMLYKMPLSTKESQPMYSLDREAVAQSNQLSMSSDEKTLYYTKKLRMSFDIILME